MKNVISNEKAKIMIEKFIESQGIFREFFSKSESVKGDCLIVDNPYIKGVKMLQDESGEMFHFL